MSDETAVNQLRRINTRRTHPTFYKLLMTFGLAEVLLAFNFWWYTPTFNPYGIPKNLIGVVFFMLGMLQVVFLAVFRDLTRLRFVVAASSGFAFFWGISNTQQVFNGNASFQLPILLVTGAVAQIWLLTEAPVNPVTERGP